jgi:hypothetical protein
VSAAFFDGCTPFGSADAGKAPLIKAEMITARTIFIAQSLSHSMHLATESSTNNQTRGIRQIVSN